MSFVKKAEFVSTLLGNAGITEHTEALETAVSRGWAERQDTESADMDISRIEAARILHLFLQKEMCIADLPDISGASVLRDLYDCRVCVNHIAQVYLRGLMEAHEIKGISEERFLIFEGKEKLTAAEAEKIYGCPECVKEK